MAEPPLFLRRTPGRHAGDHRPLRAGRQSPPGRAQHGRHPLLPVCRPATRTGRQSHFAGRLRHRADDTGHGAGTLPEMAGRIAESATHARLPGTRRLRPPPDENRPLPDGGTRRFPLAPPGAHRRRLIQKRRAPPRHHLERRPMAQGDVPLPVPSGRVDGNLEAGHLPGAVGGRPPGRS